MPLRNECYLGVIVDNHNKQLLQSKAKPGRRDSYAGHDLLFLAHIV